MAKQVINARGFKVLQVNATEIEGSLGLCDCCNQKSLVGYMPAVLPGYYYCRECFVGFATEAEMCESDKEIESEVFHDYQKTYKIKGEIDFSEV